VRFFLQLLWPSDAPFFEGHPRIFWTSGASAACNFSWCQVNETIQGTNLWMSGFPKASFAADPEKDCVRLLVDRSIPNRIALNTDYCSALNYFVCQVNK
jgi:hypothetical protein